MKINKLLVVTLVLGLGLNNVKAQFADFLNYPVTVTPHESKDSTQRPFLGIYVWQCIYKSALRFSNWR